MNPTYFGSLNYFNDALAGFPVKSLLAAGDSLAVFKSGDDGGGSIYYHTPEATASPLLPKIYPVSYVHSGIAATAGSLSFYDDPVFVCEEGICALDKKNLSLQRSVTCRSQTVNTRLLTEDLSAVRLAKWRNYLAVLAGEHIYLADAHQTYAHPTGSFSYEWYYLTGIGCYKDDIPVYRYSGEKRSGFQILEQMRDERVENETVYSLRIDDETVYYVLHGDARIRVYPTEQREGGVLSPAKSILGLDEFLFFGTAGGDLCLFNNDKRGIAPEALSGSDDFDEEQYRQEIINTKLYGYLRVPAEPAYTQCRKCGSSASEEETHAAIAAYVADTMKRDTYYIIGAGTTTRAIMRELELENTLIGVDLVKDFDLVANDVYGNQILDYIGDKPAKLVVTVTGGQGFLFGRGNQQLTPQVLRRIGKENIIILATKEKILQLRGQPLLVDTGDAELDAQLSGYHNVICDYQETIICKVCPG
jgi:hypothetical protein